MYTYDNDEVSAAALAALDQMTPIRLARLLRRWCPSDAVDAITREDEEIDRVLEGCHGYRNALTPWRRSLEQLKPSRLADDLRTAHVRVWWAKVNDYIATTDRLATLLADDDEAPAVLFYRGSLEALGHQRAAMVGTREASPHGREFAQKLGRELAQRDVSVVSGLARGIDSAAHAGALAAQKGPPIAVVGTGINVVYPVSGRRLWEQVGQTGLILSERPLGASPHASAFPARNRVIAQLSSVVVVVESRETGGSLITADRALERGRPVLAVPGSPLLENCVGSNALLRGGAHGRVAMPCIDVSDVLAWLDVATVSELSFEDHRATPSITGEDLLRSMGWESWPTGRLAAISGLTLGLLTATLAQLEADGWIERTEGRWHRIAAR